MSEPAIGSLQLASSRPLMMMNEKWPPGRPVDPRDLGAAVAVRAPLRFHFHSPFPPSTSTLRFRRPASPGPLAAMPGSSAPLAS